MINSRGRVSLQLELFPFISLFLCVIGVLAFLQNLFVLGELGESEEEAAQPPIFQTAYTIRCERDRLVLLPPRGSLMELSGLLDLQEQSALQKIAETRERNNEAGGRYLLLNEDFDEEALRLALNEVVTINQLSVRERFAYEEYLLFEIASGGSNVYHVLREMLEEPGYRHLRSGLRVAEVAVESP